MTSPDGETIQGGHYRLEKGFDWGKLFKGVHYLRGDIN